MIRRRPKRSATAPVTSTSSSEGSELDDADEAEVERIARQVVDLPADRDRDDLRREGRQEARRPEAQEGAVAEGGIALVGSGRGVGVHCGRRTVELTPAMLRKLSDEKCNSAVLRDICAEFRAGPKISR